MADTPQIIITSSARAYLARRQSTSFCITMRELKSCCIPCEIPPQVYRGPPIADTRSFSSHEVDGLTVWFHTTLHGMESLIVDARGFGIFSWLAVSHWTWKPFDPYATNYRKGESE
jgi:hypothetical protein